MKFSVSVIIPNYNGRKLLEENIPSVIATLNFSTDDFEIIISDDASTDDSVSFIKKNYPGIKILTTAKNSGFSATANRGIKEGKKQLTLLLNSDVKLREDYLTCQFKYFSKPDTFGVMGGICDGKGKLIDAAKYPQWSGLRVKSTLNYSLLNAPENFFIPTYFLSGANALVNTEKLQRLNGFNEIFSPFYMEDVDLSARAWRLGWKCYYEPRSLCEHVVSDTIKKYSSEKKIRTVSKRNKFIFNEIHFDGGKKIFQQAEIVANLLFRWMVLDFSYYKSYFEFWKRAKQIRISKSEFENLHPVKNIEEVANEIKKSVEDFEKKLF